MKNNLVFLYAEDFYEITMIFLLLKQIRVVSLSWIGMITLIKSNHTHTILGDQSTYRRINIDPITKLTNKIKTLLRSWRENQLIDEAVYKLLNITNGNLSRCYGLPKIHKAGFPVRIIVSSLGSPLYNVFKYFHSILHNSIKKPNSHIKNG